MRCNKLGSNVRGIVDIDEQASDAELYRLHQAGARGVRINAGPPNPPRRTRQLMAKVVPQMMRMDAICAEIGWQLDLLGPYWLYEEMHRHAEVAQVEFHDRALRNVARPKRRRLAGFQAVSRSSA